MATAEKTARKNLGDFGDHRISPAIKSAHDMSFRREMRVFDNHRASLEAIRDRRRDAPHEVLNAPLPALALGPCPPAMANSAAPQPHPAGQG